MSCERGTGSELDSWLAATRSGALKRGANRTSWMESCEGTMEKHRVERHSAPNVTLGGRGGGGAGRGSSVLPWRDRRPNRIRPRLQRRAPATARYRQVDRGR